MGRIVATAHHRRTLPHEEWESYKAHPWSYALLWAFEDHRAEMERQEMERAKKGGGNKELKSPRGFGG